MITWEAEEFKKTQKTGTWYLAWGFLSLAIIVFAITQKSPLMALLFVLISVIAYLFSQKQPRKIKFIISEKGIKINNKLYFYDNLKSFWIFYDPPRKKELSLKSKKVFMPYIALPIANQNPIKIREYLLEFIPEKEHQESLADNLPI